MNRRQVFERRSNKSQGKLETMKKIARKQLGITQGQRLEFFGKLFGNLRENSNKDSRKSQEEGY